MAVEEDLDSWSASLISARGGDLLRHLQQVYWDE